MGRKKSGSHVYQITQRLHELDTIGTSKHLAKQEFRIAAEQAGQKWNPAFAPGIHSIKTMEAYRDSALRFSDWLKTYHPEIKDLSTLTPQIAAEFLLFEQERGKSPHSISRDMAAFNKLWNLGLTKKEIGLNERSYKNVTRSRGAKKHDRHVNLDNWGPQVTFSKAFGVRRESVRGGSHQVKGISIYRSTVDGRLHVSVIEKGGKFRNAPCRRSMEAEIQKLFGPVIQERAPMNEHEFRQAYSEDKSDYLFTRYNTAIDNHAFRREYAQALYEETLSEDGECGLQKYRGYDVSALSKVSKALGHNRLDVVVEHYMR